MHLETLISNNLHSSFISSYAVADQLKCQEAQWDDYPQHFCLEALIIFTLVQVEQTALYLILEAQRLQAFGSDVCNAVLFDYLSKALQLLGGA